MKSWSEAARIAMMLNSTSEMQEILNTVNDRCVYFGCVLRCRAIKIQLAYMYAGHCPFLEGGDDELNAILHNTEVCLTLHSLLYQLPARFQKIQKDLDFAEPKVPEDAYKSHLADAAALSEKGGATGKTPLANALVNGFLNVGSGKDKMTTTDGMCD